MQEIHKSMFALFLFIFLYSHYSIVNSFERLRHVGLPFSSFFQEICVVVLSICPSYLKTKFPRDRKFLQEFDNHNPILESLGDVKV